MLLRRQREHWLPVSGYEGRYEVSSFGYVRSLRGPRGGLRDVPKILAGSNGGKGYRIVALCAKEKREYFYVHRLVMSTFVGPCPDGMEVAHGDGIRKHNRLDNLEYKTPSENQADRVRHNTHDQGERSANAKLTEKAVLEVRRLWARGESLGVLAARFNVNMGTLRDACVGETWRHL